jgi:Gpi18-like mannosyltransferase
MTITQQGASGSLASRRWWPSFTQALRFVWLPWLLARIIVGAALCLSRYSISHIGVSSAKAITASHEGLTSWDASWYVQIASGGYRSVPQTGLRFFPLYPEFVGALHMVTRAPASALAVLVANVASLLACILLYLLTRKELDGAVGRRAVWLLCLSPAAFVLVMGYAEGVFLVFVLAAFACLRTKRWWLAAVFGVLCGLTRPLGLLVAIPALIEIIPALRSAPLKGKVAQVSAVLGPLVGTGLYLSWVANRYGNFFLPFSIQTGANAHGGFSNPFSVTWHASQELFHGHVGTALHVPWIGLCLILLVVCFVRLPLSYAVFTAAILLAAICGQNLDSFERYALSAFPLLMAGGTLLRSDRVALPVFSLLSVAMFAYALLAFFGAYVP